MCFDAIQYNKSRLRLNALFFNQCFGALLSEPYKVFIFSAFVVDAEDIKRISSTLNLVATEKIKVAKVNYGF